ncbi:hypothetical protein C8Q79DRAFT_439806 [Trametes meyenii]|nr:hypothetical protein C8Q79DRAFT_439806 [Trametes meyenii]
MARVPVSFSRCRSITLGLPYPSAFIRISSRGFPALLHPTTKDCEAAGCSLYVYNTHTTTPSTGVLGSCRAHRASRHSCPTVAQSLHSVSSRLSPAPRRRTCPAQPGPIFLARVLVRARVCGFPLALCATPAILRSCPRSRRCLRRIRTSLYYATVKASLAGYLNAVVRERHADSDPGQKRTPAGPRLPVKSRREHGTRLAGAPGSTCRARGLVTFTTSRRAGRTLRDDDIVCLGAVLPRSRWRGDTSRLKGKDERHLRTLSALRRRRPAPWWLARRWDSVR